MKEINAIKRFVAKHKVALSVTTTALICVAINRQALKQHNEFLKEKNLYDEFYTPE